MTPEEVRALRQQVREIETQKKMRKRRKPGRSQVPEDSTDVNNKDGKENKRRIASDSRRNFPNENVGNTINQNLGYITNENPGKVENRDIEGSRTSRTSETTSKVPASKSHNSSREHQLKKAIGPTPEYIEAIKAAYANQPDTLLPDQAKIIHDMGMNFNGEQLSLHECANSNYDRENGERYTYVNHSVAVNGSANQSYTANRSETSVPFAVPISLPTIRNRLELPGLFSNLNGSSPPPLDLEYYKDSGDINPGSPAAMLNFFKELTLFNTFHSSKISLADELDDNHTERNRVEDTAEIVSLPNVKLSRNFNIPEFMEFVLNYGSPDQLNNLALSFNTAFGSSPQPSLSVLPGLDYSGNYLYNYYVDTLSRKVSIAPRSQDESNSYQKVFLPLAQKDKGVLYGILAWAGFHLGGAWLAEGSRYAEMAVKQLTQDVDFNNPPTLKQDRRTIFNKLAALMILCGAEICRGDVKYWTVYLNWGWKLLRDNGGILNFGTNKEEHWLISNFAYHDLMASSTSQRGTYFPTDTYQRIFTDPDGVSKGNLNPLLGVCKTLFNVIGEISSLAYDSKKTLDEYYNRSPSVDASVSPSTNSVNSPENKQPYYLTEFNDGSDLSEHGRNSQLLLSIIEKSRILERSIDTAKPDSEDLMDLIDSELELQLTAFEAFQLSCKLYLRQSIMKCNPSSLESQVLVNDLVKCIDILIDSPMQATLVFPVFMTGIHMVTDDDKIVMRQRIQKFMDTYGTWSVVRVKYLIEQVWERNPDGDRVVDWHSILVELGWDLNFA